MHSHSHSHSYVPNHMSVHTKLWWYYYCFQAAAQFLRNKASSGGSGEEWMALRSVILLFCTLASDSIKVEKRGHALIA